MQLPLTATVFAALGAWLILLFGRGGFWRARLDGHLGARPAAGGSRPTVYAVVPARNEAAVVGEAIGSLIAQEYAGTFAIFLVDDHSTDGTAQVAQATAGGHEAAARLTVVQAAPLEAGWTGKLSAMHSGVRAALAHLPPPDYWLFTDADIRHDPLNVESLVSKVQEDDLALVSLMVRLRCASAWERLLIPAFVFFFQKLYPFAWVNDRARATAAAAGGCMLLANRTLCEIGGLPAIRGRLIDDCALGAAVKATGASIWLGLTDLTSSIRCYDTLGEVWSMVKRTAYTQLGYSPYRLLLTVAGMLLLYVAPIAALTAGLLLRDGILCVLSLATLGLIAIAYGGTVRAYRLPRRWTLTLPLAAAMYTAMTVDSALAYAQSRGGGWKGRTYAPAGDQGQV
ncbi:MAG TPA: glycosyltransferase [Candidatus Acidoferrales bacterium]|nr:glycosyltransferase [Candidatus Acidoferrales bacterium]